MEGDGGLISVTEGLKTVIIFFNLGGYLLAKCSIGAARSRIVMASFLVHNPHKFEPGVVFAPVAPHPTLPHRHDCRSLPRVPP